MKNYPYHVSYHVNLAYRNGSGYGDAIISVIHDPKIRISSIEKIKKELTGIILEKFPQAKAEEVLIVILNIIPLEDE